MYQMLFDVAGIAMVGPVGFLGYWAVRTVRRRDPRVAWGEREKPEADARRVGAALAVEAPRFEDVVTGSTLAARFGGLWRRHPYMTGVGLLGFGFAAATASVAAWNGGWLLAPEGRLLEAVKFDVALAIYILTIAVILPLAPMDSAARRHWIGLTVGFTLYSYVIENVQAWRGLDPRFSEIAGPFDQFLGLAFLFQALGLLVLFVILMRLFFRDDALPDHPALRLALRYSAGGVLIAFGVGILMSAIGGREVGTGGNLMPIHAAGFHALQAVPLVPLLLGGAALPAADVLRWTHVGGVGWLLLCTGLVTQAIMGQPPMAPTPVLGLSVVGALMWAGALGYTLRAREFLQVVGRESANQPVSISRETQDGE